MPVAPEPGANERAPGAAELFSALRRLPPRSSQLLGYRALDGRSAQECARLYGTNEAAISVHVLRAARLLQAALASPAQKMLPSHEAPLTSEEEERAARALADRLDRPASPRLGLSTSGVHGSSEEEIGNLLLHLRALAPEVRALARAREREGAASPTRRWADWLRRLVVAALAALALWLYLRGRMKTLFLLALLSSFSFFGCRRRAETNVAGSDEEMIDRYATRLEELGVRLRAARPECGEICSMNQEGCDLARKICEIAAREPERLEGRCAFAQEECAKLGDACLSCRR